MYDPRMRDPVLLLLAAAFFAAVALWTTPGSLPEWLKLLMALCAIILGVMGVFALLDWLFFRFASRLQEINQARIAPALALAKALRGLSAAQTDIVNRHDVANVVGRYGNGRVHWVVRCLTMDVPLGFVEDVLRASRQTWPYLWPVRQPEPFSEEWVRADQMLKSLTDSLVSWKLAEKASGPYAAKLMEPLSVVAQRFGVEL